MSPIIKYHSLVYIIMGGGVSIIMNSRGLKYQTDIWPEMEDNSCLRSVTGIPSDSTVDVEEKTIAYESLQSIKSPIVFRSSYVCHRRFYIDPRYENLRAIGNSAFGLVASAYDTITGQYVAIKRVKGVFRDLRSARRILRELTILRHLKNHENIVRTCDIMSVPSNTLNMDDIYIVTNLFETDLRRVIQSGQGLSDKHVKFFMYQILLAVKYIHSANVVHRDLKPSNILINADCEVALCDFGMPQDCVAADEQNDTLMEIGLTCWYHAPELLCNCVYGKPVDVWSAGCIFAEIMTGRPLFRGQNTQHQMLMIVSKLGCPPADRRSIIVSEPFISAILSVANEEVRPFEDRFTTDVDPLALQLMRKMLAFHPEDRVTVEEALNHAYFSEFNSLFVESESKEVFDFNLDNCISHDLCESELRALFLAEVKLYRDG